MQCIFEASPMEFLSGVTFVEILSLNLTAISDDFARHNIEEYKK